MKKFIKWFFHQHKTIIVCKHCAGYNINDNSWWESGKSLFLQFFAVVFMVLISWLVLIFMVSSTNALKRAGYFQLPTCEKEVK